MFADIGDNIWTEVSNPPPKKKKTLAVVLAPSLNNHACPTYCEGCRMFSVRSALGNRKQTKPTEKCRFMYIIYWRRRVVCFLKSNYSTCPERAMEPTGTPSAIIVFILLRCMSITVAARSEPWTVFVCSNTGIVGSIPTRGMDMYACMLCLCM
jgi:hypothetical protein